jgi:hypothetical protein
MQPVPITTKVLSSYPTHAEMYSKHYVIKFLGDLRQFGTPVSSTNKTDCHDITETLLILTLNTITLTL